MRQSVFQFKGTAVSKACVVTAVLNSIIAASHAQPAEPVMPGDEPPVDLAERALRYGPFDLRPNLRVGAMYDDNIFIRSDDVESDVLFYITPGLMLGSGDYIRREANSFSLYYSPNFILFTDHSDENSIDHDARMRAEMVEGRWRLTLEQDFTYASGATVDVGDRVDRSIYATHLAFKYEVSPKTSAELTARQLINDYHSDSLNDFNEWTFGGAGDYAITPKVKLGLGVTGGFVDVDHGANQTYEQILFRASYFVSEKVVANGAAGVEFRQFDGDQDNRTDGVFNLGATYTPLVNTSVRLEAYRRNQASVSTPDQNYTATGISAGVRQIFRVKYAGSLAAGYENADYHETTPGVSATREDNYYFVRVGFDWTVIERLTVGAFYLFRQNDSENGPDFTNNQVGIAAGYQF